MLIMMAVDSTSSSGKARQRPVREERYQARASRSSCKL